MVKEPEENPELGVIRSYPLPVQLIQGIGPFLSLKLEFPGAGLLADRLVTLPTNCYVTVGDCELLAKAVT
jgi:hypothetical protein